MIDEAELFYKIESKQFELDYNNSFDKDIREYSKTKGQVEALEWVKRLIAEESDDDFQLDYSIKLGKEWS
ncbi:hypothetical protein [Fusobacterium vincentii]|uniref:hypothetical protein n=1 Tax=Fusobacterium vincentii TaxID=155615 RepID=UPI002B2F42FA|nr:hypothetical protein FVTDC_06610 [Fusobacterium vincentii]